jgi:predicted DNA-binding protein (UPF0278 family)
MALKSSLTDLDTQIEKLRERRKILVVKSADRFAKAATKSGLAEMEIADEDVDKIFEELTARFRKSEKKGTSGAAPPTRREPDDEAGTSEAISNDD